MTELARSKLFESEFFLGKLDEATSEREFQYHLSAFLSSCWSVFDQLRFEWACEPEFKERHNKQKSRLYNDEFFFFMIKARHAVVHVGRPAITDSITAEKIDDSTVVVTNDNDQDVHALIVVDGTPETVREIKSNSSQRVESLYSEAGEFEVSVPFYMKDIPRGPSLPESHKGKPVVYLCEEFQEEMESLIKTVEREFKFTPN